MLLAALAKTTYCGLVSSSLGPEIELNWKCTQHGQSCVLSSGRAGPFCPRSGHTWRASVLGSYVS